VALCHCSIFLPRGIATPQEANNDLPFDRLIMLVPFHSSPTSSPLLACHTIPPTQRSPRIANMNMVFTSPRTSFWPRLPLFQLFITLHFIVICFAQENSSAMVSTMDSITKVARSSSVVSGPAQTHTIQVGLADHKFVPNVTEAAVGDVSVSLDL